MEKVDKSPKEKTFCLKKLFLLYLHVRNWTIAASVACSYDCISMFSCIESNIMTYILSLKKKQK